LPKSSNTKRWRLRRSTPKPCAAPQTLLLRPRFSVRIKRRRFGYDPSGGESLIAELKRASPSKGILAPHLDLFQVADIYTQNGASAISVLTDEKFFMGKLETLA
jgi:indole-3-glycerol phosphate synthase